MGICLEFFGIYAHKWRGGVHTVIECWKHWVCAYTETSLGNNLILMGGHTATENSKYRLWAMLRILWEICSFRGERGVVKD